MMLIKRKLINLNWTLRKKKKNMQTNFNKFISSLKKSGRKILSYSIFRKIIRSDYSLKLVWENNMKKKKRKPGNFFKKKVTSKKNSSHSKMPILKSKKKLNYYRKDYLYLRKPYACFKKKKTKIKANLTNMLKKSIV